MTNEQILKKAAEKAVKNGWDDETAIAFIHSGRDIGEITSREYYGTIFFHNFAKAFWFFDGETHLKAGLDEWQWHLQQMVLEEKPLQYLKKFL